VCSPVEGMQINCIAKHINKAGIRAEVKDTPSPVVIFIARDHNYSSQLFSQVKENDNINVRVIGQRFELNDTYISIIAQLIEETSANKHIELQPKNGDEEPTSQLNVEPSQPIVKKKTSLLKIRKSKPKLTINE
jgi:CTP synthase (UTP-ammonia lyase)